MLQIPFDNAQLMFNGITFFSAQVVLKFGWIHEFRKQFLLLKTKKMNTTLNVFSCPISITSLIENIKESKTTTVTFLDSGSCIDSFPTF